MHIIYSVVTCSSRTYTRLFADVKDKPAFQSQKYHRLLIEGLAAHAKVDVVANPPVNRKVLSEKILRLPKEYEGGACYRYIPAIRNPALKALCVGFGTFFRTLLLGNRKSVVIVDCLNRITALAALLAARLSGKRCIGIVTDLPEMLNGSKLYMGLADFVIRHCTNYIFLTEAMNSRLNSKEKPYVVLEGHSDITMVDCPPDPAKKKAPRIVLYAGAVGTHYGLPNLVEGFRMADLENAQLHIYGSGNYVEALEAIAREDERVFYGGMLLNTEIVAKEQEATLLVNPRPTQEEFVKYSFPSKTMEYMASGTPVMTTVLPGMPREYHPHVFLLRDETAVGIAASLKEVLALSDAELYQKGCEARKFVLEEKNNVVQARKILDMLNETQRK